MRPGSVLIVGAGLAGSAAAWHLEGTGWRVTAVDPTASIPESFLLQLDEAAQTMLSAIGADHLVDRFSAPSPRVSMRWGKDEVRRTSFSSGDMRLAVRHQLVAGVREMIPDTVIRKIGRRVSALSHTATGVAATFDDGSRDSYDLVVGADGIGSTVRRLMFGPDQPYLYRNGLAHVWFKVRARTPGDNAVIASRDGVAWQIYPYPDPRTTLALAAMEVPDDAHHDPGDLSARCSQLIRELGHDLTAVADAVAAVGTPFISRFTQVRMPTWSTGRTVLIGDAAHCIDPLSGLGAHASLLDASVLAHALQTQTDHHEAFDAYEARVRPFVQAGQNATSRILEYVTTPHGVTRASTLRGALRDAARLTPQLVRHHGRASITGRPPAPRPGIRSTTTQPTPCA
ncbi:FAD-dependent monooxygenase [Nocardioides sp. Arc9.136]|uniref:FAD-dependent monooxygenase n=1 Tax=Nocardioides sp. Arc9.136 TaxID=2996826 RepID=UPI0026662753|nr:FAD-dependent monooxygenase [Nocardioides sp. Arc9.136]WKN46554.1 FAD-dependent monooxygenase [Nocardioides sp. Arc9.136]